MRILLLIGLVLTSGCTILNIPITVTGPKYPGGFHHPHPWLYPDSVFCDDHPNECIGDNDV